MTLMELDKALRAEERLAQELTEYPGRWVAIKDRRIAASAESLEELLEGVDPGELDRVFEVSPETFAGCLY